MNYFEAQYRLSSEFIEIVRAMYLFLAAIAALLATATAFEVTNPPNPDEAKKHGMKDMFIDMYTPLSVTWNVVK